MTHEISASPTPIVRLEKCSNISTLLCQDSLQKFRRVDDCSFMCPVADEAGVVRASNAKAQVSALDRDELDIGRHSHSNRCGSDVTDVDVCPNCLEFRRQCRSQQFDAGPLDESDHERGGKHRRHIREPSEGARERGYGETLVDAQLQSMLHSDDEAFGFL